MTNINYTTTDDVPKKGAFYEEIQKSKVFYSYQQTGNYQKKHGKRLLK